MAPDPSRWHRRSRCTPLFWLAGARSPARMYRCSDRSNRTTYTIATEGQLSACTDTPSWLAAGEGCEQYAARRCSRGSLLAAAAAAAAAAAVQHCCLCGKWREAVAASTPTCWDGALEDPGVPWGSSAFCPAWPSQNRSQLPTPTRALVRTAVRVALRPFASRGIRREQIREALAQRCAQRLCLHVQIRRGAVYVVAPSSRACRRPPCGHSSLRGEHWPTAWSPSSLEWHLAAGLNVSTCSTGVRRGDYNGPFTRLRLLTALRLLHESAARGAADTELALCAGEVAINAGGAPPGATPGLIETSTISPRWRALSALAARARTQAGASRGSSPSSPRPQTSSTRCCPLCTGVGPAGARTRGEQTDARADTTHGSMSMLGQWPGCGTSNLPCGTRCATRSARQTGTRSTGRERPPRPGERRGRRPPPASRRRRPLQRWRRRRGR